MEADIEREGRMCHEEALIRCGGGVGGGGKVGEVDIGREGRLYRKADEEECRLTLQWENNSHLSLFS